MKRVAILFNGNLSERKGYLNSVLERAKSLIARDEFSVDVFCLSQYDYWLIRQLRHSEKREKLASIIIDGITINLIWYPFSLVDYILSVKLHVGKVIEPIFLRRLVSKFKNYDLITAHSVTPGLLAYGICEKYNIPYCITWHGSDIHTEPFENRKSFKIASNLMKVAACNMFVSQALKKTAQKINQDVEGVVLYNAASDIFYRYDDDKRLALRTEYQTTEYRKIVAFVGGLVTVKNADLLPDIFKSIQQNCKEKVEFWIIGDGKLRSVIEHKLAQMPELSCKLWGNQKTEMIPLLLNCVDVVVLPSKNEGLPLIVVEALCSGANVVASDVGGVKEVLVDDNTISLGGNFVCRFANRVVEILNMEENPVVPSGQYDWRVTAELESRVYQRILNN